MNSSTILLRSFAFPRLSQTAQSHLHRAFTRRGTPAAARGKTQRVSASAAPCGSPVRIAAVVGGAVIAPGFELAIGVDPQPRGKPAHLLIQGETCGPSHLWPLASTLLWSRLR